MFGDAHDLVERCIKRDQGAWVKFIDKFSGLLYYSARSRLRRSGMAFNEHDIEDIVQIVFTEIWEKCLLEDVRERHKIRSWLSIIAQTRALNYMRKKKESLLREHELYMVDDIADERAYVPDEGLMEKLENAISGLGDRERIILKLNVIHGKTHREIAAFMKIPLNTVSTIIARKKAVLKERFMG
jgi:RNA polymerase sigma-70 factor (ECF subfamily)